MRDRIHQLYCTHCTYGTSALHRRTDGAVKDQAFEYSTRACSVERDQSHDYFRKIETYLYLHLPSDAPPTDLTRYSGADCPWRRLVFLPEIGGLNVLAHVCYRQTDTRGRPGSYFAHVLMHEQGHVARQWSAEECLKLWDRPEWVIADSPETDFDLPALDSLEQFCSSDGPAAIDDEVLHSFLTAESDGEFVDPGDVIPQRWRARSQSERRQLLIGVLHSVLDLRLDPPRRESLVVVIEPGLAALIFYGVARLLPRKGFGERLSFSTFESGQDRPRTALTAVTFRDPEKADLPAEAYRSENVVLNSYNGKRSARRARTGESKYAAQIVERFASAEEGAEWVEEFRARCDFHQMATSQELEECIAAEDLANVLLPPSPDEEAIPVALPRSKKARGVLREIVAVRLSFLGCESTELEELAASEEQSLNLIRVLASDGGTVVASDELSFLLDRLPDSAVSTLLTFGEVDPGHRAAALTNYVERNQQLPDDCEWLLSERLPASLPPDTPTLDRLFAELSATTLNSVVWGLLGRETGDEGLKVVARSLLNAARADSQKQAVAQVFFKNVPLTALRRFLADPALREYLLTEETLGKRVHQILTGLLAELHRGGPKFRERLSLLTADRRLLAPEARTRVRAWQSFCSQIEKIRDLKAEEPGRLKRLMSSRHQHDLEGACERLRDAAEAAFPEELTGTERQKQYRELVRAFLPPDGLPDELTRLNRRTSP